MNEERKVKVKEFGKEFVMPIEEFVKKYGFEPMAPTVVFRDEEKYVYGVFYAEDGGDLRHLFKTEEAAKAWILNHGYICEHTGKNDYYINRLRLWKSYVEFVFVRDEEKELREFVDSAAVELHKRMLEEEEKK